MSGSFFLHHSEHQQRHSQVHNMLEDCKCIPMQRAGQRCKYKRENPLWKCDRSSNNSYPHRWLPVCGGTPGSPAVPLVLTGRRGKSRGHKWQAALQASPPPGGRPPADSSQSGPFSTGKSQRRCLYSWKETHVDTCEWHWGGDLQFRQQTSMPGCIVSLGRCYIQDIFNLHPIAFR